MKIAVDYGAKVELIGRFSSKGEPVDPGNVICSVQAPDGTVTNPSVTKVVAGEYRAFFTPPGPGDQKETYECVMDGYGENQAAQPALKLEVRKRTVPRPPEA
jgi:hypothetical protein